jgi:hypothetical protein
MPRKVPNAKRPEIEKEFRFAVVMYGGVSVRRRFTGNLY